MHGHDHSRSNKPSPAHKRVLAYYHLDRADKPSSQPVDLNQPVLLTGRLHHGLNGNNMIGQAK